MNVPSDQPTDDPSSETLPGEMQVRDILDRLRNIPGNPISRARRLVELQVPPSQRGPGWDRHWRELEAYLETPMMWVGISGSDEDDIEADE